MAFLRHQSPKHWISPTEILQLPPTHFSKSDNGLWPIQSSFYGGILGFFWQGYCRVSHLRTKGSSADPPHGVIPWEAHCLGLSLLFPNQHFPLAHTMLNGARRAQLCHIVAFGAPVWISAVFARQRQVSLVFTQPCTRLFGVGRFVWYGLTPPEASASAAVHCHSLGNISPSNPQGLAKFRKCRCMWTKTRNSS